MSSHQVTVVGGGIAGIACARLLSEAGEQVRVLDRGRVPGGRMATRALPTRTGRRVDTGASYFTVRDPGFRAVVDDWAARGLARPWTDTFAVLQAGVVTERKSGPVRWSAPGGLRSLVEDLATGLDVTGDTHVQSVRSGTVDGQPAGTVVLAMPDPQALQVLDGSLIDERAALADRAWDPVLALVARWPERSWDWDGAFVHGSDVVDWLADDGTRRGDGAPVLVAHSTPAFAATRLVDPPAAAAELVAGVRAAAGLGEPVEVQHVQRWTYAKPVGTREASYFLGEQRVGLCGDGWGASKIEAAWASGTALAKAVLAQPVLG